MKGQDQMQPRIGTITRNTQESDVSVTINLDGTGNVNIETGVFFFNHVLTLFARRGEFDLEIHAVGAPDVDEHNVIEDVGIALGEAIAEAVTVRRNIKQLGSALVPIGEALCEAVVDLFGIPISVVNGEPEWMATAVVMSHYATAVNESFFECLAMHAHMTLHLNCRYGHEPEHITEAEFCAVGRALRQALDGYGA
ncbi:imidazoleglycerol-phosphate dehydratase [Corynebacterium sp. HS2168-gen11]|uniref:imidazoleglycerol-phosphate dehydratase n=1 Tax=Corynebacterium sp. HS2168-gen11 TaxID=2974027 RepID=UPI00216ADC24|nr:imidazoleglycerol-phosphate dehydratase [Corynebacterium sp. HS2168-gen11]MCS4536241.1 imidazoleglycerol-phosphate dehydratase [Corynebacterium sp. HS2168-gen11]